jgi:hypothetical protein
MERRRLPPPPPSVPITRLSGSTTHLASFDANGTSDREISETRFIIGLDYGTTCTGKDKSESNVVYVSTDAGNRYRIRNTIRGGMRIR